MDRTACIDIPALPLQLLLRRRPEWCGRPVAVVAQDKPQSPILWVNERARSASILPGMKYAAGLSLDPDLCAETVGQPEIDTAVLDIHRRLSRYSPVVEPSPDEPGIFWLDASGLGNLYDSLKTWATQLQRDLQAHGLRAVPVVGFSRFGTWAVARTRRRVTVLASNKQERMACNNVQLRRLPIPARVLQQLEHLAVSTIGDLVRLPATGVRDRYGDQVWQIYREARGEIRRPLRGQVLPVPARRRQYLDDAETNQERLLFLIKRLLHNIITELEAQQELVCRLHLVFVLEDGQRVQDTIQPAVPTWCRRTLLDLIRLRLASIPVRSGIVELTMTADSEPVSPRNRDLLERHKQRDQDAAQRAMARVRAEFGAEAVLQPRLRPGHLPEARVTWEPFSELNPPRAQVVQQPSLVRRVLARPQRLQQPPLCAPAAVDERHWPARLGSYLLSGGWWQQLVRREYQFVARSGGGIDWLYFDRVRRRWVRQGRVE